mgnify:CR=1 FL=1
MTTPLLASVVCRESDPGDFVASLTHRHFAWLVCGPLSLQVSTANWVGFTASLPKCNDTK